MVKGTIGQVSVISDDAKTQSIQAGGRLLKRKYERKRRLALGLINKL